MKLWKRPPICNKICLGFKQIVENKEQILLALDHVDDRDALSAALDYIKSVTQWYWTKHPHKRPRHERS